MDMEKVIKGLEFTKAMITFNPSTGEDIEPGNLNEANKTTYDACVGAIALLKEQDDMGKELTDAMELIHKKNERIKKLEEQIETITKWRANAGAFD